MVKKKLSHHQRQHQQLQQLEQRRAELKQQLLQLQQANVDLSRTTLTMHSICDSLSVLQLRENCLSGAETEEDAMMQQLLALLEEEGGLLQQLQGLPAPQHPAAAATEGQPALIAPPGDPVAYFKHLLCQPRVNLSQVTLEHVRATYTEMVQGVSIQLNLHRECLLSEAEAAARIQSLIVKLMGLTNQAMVEGRRDLVNGLLRHVRLDVPACQPATDAATPACPEANAAADMAAAVVAKMGLSSQQEEMIGGGLLFFRRLLQYVDVELAALQQGAAAAAAPGVDVGTHSGDGSGSHSSSSQHGSGSSRGASECEEASSDGTNSSSGNSGELGQLLATRQVELEAEQQRATRLQVVCRKHALLTSAATCWLAGQLTWLQLGKMTVLFWPYVPVWQHVWVSISRRWQERQQSQQQIATAATTGATATAAAAAVPAPAAQPRAAAAAAADAGAAAARGRSPVSQQGCVADSTGFTPAPPASANRCSSNADGELKGLKISGQPSTNIREVLQGLR